MPRGVSFRFSTAKFLAAATTLFSSTATGPDKVAYPILKHLPRSDMDFFLHIFIFPGFCIPFFASGRYLSLFPTIRWHPAPFHKLISPGRPPCLLCWTPSFLSDRRVCVVFENHNSRSFRVRNDPFLAQYFSLSFQQ